MRRTIVLLVLVVAALATPVAANAHASLVESSPGKGERLAELPASVTLTLNEDVAEPAFVVVTAPDGTRLEGDVTVDGREVTAPLDPSEAAGTYSVAYRLVSADGHTVNGSYEFDVAPPATTAPSPAPSESPAPSLDDDPITTTPVEDSGTDGLSAVIVIGFFFVALAGFFFIIRAGMRAGQEPGED